jgi:hypothetical protein
LKGDILSTLKNQSFKHLNNASIKDRPREYQLSERVWGQEKKKCIFFLSPINSRKEGRKKREFFILADILQQVGSY